MNFNNAMYFLKDKLVNILPSLFKFQMTPVEEDVIEMEEYDHLCSDIQKLNSPDFPLFMVNILKIGDLKAYNKHKSVVKQIFAMIGTRMFSFGKPEAEYWDELAIVKYQTRVKLCEMLLSKEFQDTFPSSVKGIIDGRIYSTVQIF